jgi:type IV pilus assembly protein PilN
MAMRINLLDWRAARRERIKQQFFVLMGLSAAACAAVVGLIWFSVVIDISDQRARNTFLQDQIAEADQKIKEIDDLERTKANLLARMKVIEELQASRSASVHFFDEMLNTLPEGVTITAIKQQGGAVTVDGIAESNGRVSTYMKNIEASQWFAEPVLVVIQASEKDSKRQSEFTLQFKNLTQAKPQAEDGEGAQ